MNVMPKIYVPQHPGRLAVEELDDVPWHALEHAYGTGRGGEELYEDVEATLRALGNEGVTNEVVEAVFSNICHQGTIYEATAHAVPFLAAFAAGSNLSPEDALFYVVLLASVGIAASFDAPTGSHSGSWGVGVASLTREAIRASRDHFATAARRHSALVDVTDALAAMVRSDTPDPEVVARLEALVP